MLNILIPLSGKNTFETTSVNAFPRILNEIDGKLLIERAAEPFIKLDLEKSITVALPQPESEKYQLTKVLSLLGSDIKTCAINGQTQGSVCSALLAIEELDLDSPLLISSFEQVIDFDITSNIKTFINEEIDAGVFTFEALHPKWSYVKTDENDYVMQAAEKMPISNQAIAGLFYFKSARLFIESAKSMIRKDVKTNGNFFISPTLNEVILNEGKVRAIAIDKSKYFHVSDEHALESYEQKISERNTNEKSIILQKTNDYIDAFNRKDINLVSQLLSNTFTLIDPAGTFAGRSLASKYINEIFDAEPNLSFIAKQIHVAENLRCMIEFELFLKEKRYIGVDLIEWNEEYQMTNMKAYLYEVSHG